ncbi:MAG TPA: tagaturonate reductase [Gemmataceae bacterium]|nr:tagaturonate reductase [Gemmataceae bacterium]
MDQIPETVLQFGSGKFLRAFADLFIHQANAEGQNVGRVVVVQSTGEGRADLLNRQHGRYHVLVRGLAHGQTVDRVEEAASVSRALSAAREWSDVLAVARSPELRLVISNTAEVGYNLDPTDSPNITPPRSFPAKLLHVLHERYRAQQPGVIILPCELFEHNADMLRGIIIRLAEDWGLPGDFRDWLENECRWHNTLVDRIVAVAPPGHPLLAEDPLTTVAEPYALWAIEVKRLPSQLFRHPAITETTNVEPYFLRKVRILNAAHTALLSQAIPRGLRFVRDAVLDPAVGAWLHRLLFEEIVPVVEGRVDDAPGFANQVLERFRNPFLEHKLSDIAVYHEAKVKIRLVPTRDEFQAKFGKVPPLLEAAIAWKP